MEITAADVETFVRLGNDLNRLRGPVDAARLILPWESVALASAGRCDRRTASIRTPHLEPVAVLRGELLGCIRDDGEKRFFHASACIGLTECLSSAMASNTMYKLLYYSGAFP